MERRHGRRSKGAEGRKWEGSGKWVGEYCFEMSEGVDTTVYELLNYVFRQSLFRFL
jgi:hypothetical protein